MERGSWLFLLLLTCRLFVIQILISGVYVEKTWGESRSEFRFVGTVVVCVSVETETVVTVDSTRSWLSFMLPLFQKMEIKFLQWGEPKVKTFALLRQESSFIDHNGLWIHILSVSFAFDLNQHHHERDLDTTLTVHIPVRYLYFEDVESWIKICMMQHYVSKILQSRVFCRLTLSILLTWICQ